MSVETDSRWSVFKRNSDFDGEVLCDDDLSRVERSAETTPPPGGGAPIQTPHPALPQQRRPRTPPRGSSRQPPLRRAEPLRTDSSFAAWAARHRGGSLSPPALATGGVFDVLYLSDDEDDEAATTAAHGTTAPPPTRRPTPAPLPAPPSARWRARGSAPPEPHPPPPPPTSSPEHHDPPPSSAARQTLGARRGVVGSSADTSSRDSGKVFDRGRSDGFPPGYSFRHGSVAQLLRALLATPPAERGPTPAVQAFNDVDFVELLEAFDTTHGFVLEHDGLGDTTHDERALPRLSPEQWVWAHSAFKKELDRGWAFRCATRTDIPWPVFRTNRWSLTEKKSLGRQVRDSHGALKWRLVDNCSDGMWPSFDAHGNCTFAGGDSVNDHAPHRWNEARYHASGDTWDGAWFDDVSFASKEIIRLKRRFGDCWVSKIDEDAAYKAFPFASQSRRFFGRWVLDPTVPIPPAVLDGSRQPLESECVYLFSTTLNFGARASATLYHRWSRAFNALYLWAANPAVAHLAVDPERLSCARYVDDGLPMVGCDGDGATDGGLAVGKTAKERYIALLHYCGLNFSAAKDASEGATTNDSRIYLGVELLIADEMKRIPAARVADALVRLRAAVKLRRIPRKAFQSLVGTLNCAGSCMPFARVYLHPAWQALSTQRGRWIHQSRALRVAWQWWLSWLESSNGVSLCYESQWEEAPTAKWFTDASFSGLGGLLCLPDGTVEYFHSSWEDLGVNPHDFHIGELEIATLAFSADLFAHHFRSRKLWAWCDNMSTCDVLRNEGAKCPGMHVCLRRLHQIMARDSFLLRGRHIRTEVNTGADELSRPSPGHLDRFRAWARKELGATSFVRVAPPGVPALMQRVKRAHDARAAALLRRGNAVGRA